MVSHVSRSAFDGPQRGGRRIVDLVGEPGGERAEGDERFALASHGVDVADRLVDAVDHVLAEREPLARRAGRGPPTAPGTRGRRSCRRRSPGSRTPPLGVAPRPQPAGPLTWRRHRHHDRLVSLIACRYRLDAAVEQDPQVVRRFDLRGTARRPRAKATVVPGGDQLRQLLVGQIRRSGTSPAVPRQIHRRCVTRVSRYRWTRLTATRSFADRRRDPLHRGEPHVARGEDAGSARLEQERRPRQRPPPGLGLGDRDLGAGEDEPACVAGDGVAEPLGARRRADEREQPFGRFHLLSMPVARSTRVSDSR